MSLVPPAIEEFDEQMIALLRQKTPAQKLASAHAMWRYARRRVTAMIQQEHPDWDNAHIKQEIRRRTIGSG
jgi:hypothetical protein